MRGNPPRPPPTCAGPSNCGTWIPIRNSNGPRALTLLAGLGKDPKSGVTTAEAESFTQQAVAALREAVNAGWAQLDLLKEPDFDPLGGRGDFQKLAAELEAKAGPKARPGN